MITPISFGSNYLVKNSQNKFQRKKFFQFQRFSSKIVNRYDGCSAVFTCERTKDKKEPYIEKAFLCVPDRIDRVIENYCRNNDISYKKFSNKNP